MGNNLGDFRPKSMDDFVGFTEERENLRDNITVLHYDISEAINDDNDSGGETFKRFFVPAPHVLMVGLPGFGKTTLGELYAAELAKYAIGHNWPTWERSANPVYEWTGVGLPRVGSHRFRFVRLDATKIKSFDELDAYLYWIEAYGVILIDEIHALKPSLQENLLDLLHEGSWYSPLAGRRLQHMGWTLIGTTTDESKLGDAFKSRFDTKIELRRYHTDDLNAIVTYAASVAGVRLSDEAVQVVVDRGRETPRDIVKIVRKIRDRAVIEGEMGNLQSAEIATKSAEMLGYGPYGLTERDIEVLMYLYKNGKVGARTLAQACRYGSVANYEDAEKYLVMKNLVIPGVGGRRISDEGLQIVSHLKT